MCQRSHGHPFDPQCVVDRQIDQTGNVCEARRGGGVAIVFSLITSSEPVRITELANCLIAKRLRAHR